ncbi:lytic polysaccharide monooxygenase [Paenibacillus sp. IHBB 10380]|uniref:lytic polysaccharide monooxygenase n=1 Tax=Paenibacillus sp. IHBB 10380 TaxID=1566358 RepID=UPI0009E2C5F0|nr:lytic polysaccharide monooxygenase [Paenibacillus sp. IHBB 10380]
MTTQRFNLHLSSKVTALMVGFSVILLGFAFSLVFAQNASAHGYIESPASRAYMCKQGENTNCGSVQYEPQSIESIGNFPTTGPADGQITGGGIFKELYEQKSDRWKKVTLQTGLNTFTWKLTAPHATDNWKYYITKANWDPNKPIGRDDIELLCSFDDKGAKPNPSTSHQCNIPADRTGYQLILGVWDIADTPMAFYQVIDANIVSNGTVQGPTVPANVSSTNKTATSVTLTWTASTAPTGIAKYEVYRNSNLVGTSVTNSYVDQELTANTAYVYTVRSVDVAGGKSQTSPAVTITTSADNGGNNGNTNPEWISTKAYVGGEKVQYNGTSYEAKWWTQNEIPGKAQVWKLISDAGQGPTVPTGVHSMKTTYTSVSLMWTASTAPTGITQYEIYSNHILVGTSTTTAYEAIGLSANTSYVFTVKAIDGAGNKSQASSAFTVKTSTDGGTGGNEGNNYPKWDATKAYVGGEKVQYNGASYEAKWWTQNEIPDKAQVWKLISDAGQGPTVPTGVHSMKTTSTSVSLMWTASTAPTGITQYEIYSNHILVGTSTTTAYEAIGLSANTSYVFTVKAIDGAGNKSQASSAFTVKTSTDGGTGGNEGNNYPKWDAKKAYVGGEKVQYNGTSYEAKWWTQNEIPDNAQVWKQI